MASKEKNTTPVPTQISAAPVAVRTAVAPAAAQAASSSQLKGSTETRLKTDGATPSAGLHKPSSNQTENQLATQETELSRWMFLQRARMAEAERTEAFDDINYHLFSYEELIKKASLTEDDIRAADIRNPKVAGMATLRVEENNSPHFYVGSNLSSYLATNPKHTGRMTNVGEAQRSTFQSDFNQRNLDIDLSGPTLMHPRLAKAVRDNPTIAGYVELTFAAAKRNGLDPVMLANQFYQESRFNPNAVSRAGARGIVQMMPFHEGKFGLSSKADFFDPAKSIEAGAEMMGNLSRKYGDQRMALVAYNGGGKAIDFVEKSLGKKEVSFSEWQDFMKDRREKVGTANKSAWHVETLHYTQIITAPPEGEQAVNVAAKQKQIRVAEVPLPGREPA